MNAFQFMTNLRSQLKTALDETIAVAAKATPHEEDEWDEYLRTHQISPKSLAERDELFALKAEQTQGALPIEVRAVLEKHKDSVSKQLKSWKDEFGSADWWPRVDGAAPSLLHEFVNEGMKQYLGRVNAQVTTVGDVFANAKSTSPSYMTNIQKSGIKSEKCPTCMAARLEGHNLNTCAFCGATIFNV
jgi:hypothetical protein